MNTQRFLLTAALAAAGLGMTGGTALAAPFTGNPATDGWNHLGNSTDPGVFARVNTSAANAGILLDYDLYATTLTVSSGSSLVTSGGIQAGDTVFGIGAVLNTPNDYQKVLVKLDDGTGNFTPSTYVPDYPADNGQKGDGLASSGSNMGSNGVLFWWSDYGSDSTDDWPTSTPTAISLTDANWSFNSAAQESAFNHKGIMFLGATDVNDQLTSFEFFFSNDAMAGGWTDLPADAEFVLSADTGSYYTDSIAAVPEPASLALLGLGGGMMLLRRRSA